MAQTPEGLDPELIAALGLRSGAELESPEPGAEQKSLPWSASPEDDPAGAKGQRRRSARPPRVRDLAERSHLLADEAEAQERAAGGPRRRRAARRPSQAGGRGGAQEDSAASAEAPVGPDAPAPEWVSAEAPPEWAVEGDLPERVSALLQEWDAAEAEAAERIAAGEEVLAPESQETEPPEPLTAAEAEQLARAVALRLLNSMPRTRHELSTKLLERDVPADAVETVLDRFEQVGLIDDAAFARAWVESRSRSKGFARGRLSQELRRKGVDAAVIAAALDQLDGDEERRRCEETALRRLGSRPLPPPGYGPDRAERDKVLRRIVGHLARKGYPQGMAIAVARSAMDRHDAGERA